MKIIKVLMCGYAVYMIIKVGLYQVTTQSPSTNKSNNIVIYLHLENIANSRSDGNFKVYRYVDTN